MKSKIILTAPGYTPVTFDSYEDLNYIWQILENYPNCKLEIVNDNNTENEVEIPESIISSDEINNKVICEYDIPKSVVFTSRFQDRIKKDIEEVLSSVYPNYYEISSIGYRDNEENLESIKLILSIKALSDDAMNTIKYIDDNIKYIINDLVEYYLS